MNSTYAFEADPLGTERWQLMTAATSLQLSAAKKAGKSTFELALKGHSYTYDLSSTEMTQKNKATGVVRKLRELPAIAFEYEANPIGSETWERCDNATCELLAEAQAAGKTGLSSVKIGEHFLYDFEWKSSNPTDMLGMTQENLSTGVKRKVRILLYWAFNDKDEWILYDHAASFALTEAALLRKPALRISVGSAEYDVDLEGKTQTNIKTKFARPIRCVTTFDEDGGLDKDKEPTLEEEEEEDDEEEEEEEDEEGSGKSIVLPCHAHPVSFDSRPSNLCDAGGKRCKHTGTTWRCAAGCDYDVCTHCFEDHCHGIQVAGGPAGKPSDGSWIAFEEGAVKACRAQLLAGKTRLERSMGGAAYRIDLSAMVQTRVSSGAERQLRFVPVQHPACPAGPRPRTASLGQHQWQGPVSVGEQVWYRSEAGADGELAVVVEAGAAGLAVKVGGQRVGARSEQLTRVVEAWEFEDPAGSGRWKACDGDMARELARNLQAGNSRFSVTIAGRGGGRAEYEVDLVEMRQVRTSTKVTRGLRLSAEAAMVSALCQLEACQRRALEHIMGKARRSHDDALPGLFRRCEELGLTAEQVEGALLYVRNRVQIVIHVKAEHLKGKLGTDTHYRNQFETGTSGGLFNTKKREAWERALFSRAYDGVDPPLRPKYGVANVVADPAGIKKCRQYGECFLELSPLARRRCTLSGVDSANKSDRDLATCQHYAHVLLNDFNDGELTTLVLIASRALSFCPSDNIVNYKEVQIHGPVRLDTDVVALHVPAAADEHALREFARKNGLRYATFQPTTKGLIIKGL